MRAKLTILSPGFGDFPSLNCMIFWVVGKNWLQPVHGLLAAESWPMFEEPGWDFICRFKIDTFFCLFCIVKQRRQMSKSVYLRAKIYV